MGQAHFKGLLVFATPGEASVLIKQFSPSGFSSRCFIGSGRWENWLLLITGVGMVHTAVHVSSLLAAHRFDLAVNIGLAGAFPGGPEILSVVAVESDALSELGADNRGEFLSISDLGLYHEELLPMTVDAKIPGNSQKILFPLVWQQLPFVQAISVNTAHGSQKAIEEVQSRFAPHIETMEGAAFSLACLNAQVPFMQIRSISNVVEPRNRDAWNIAGALKSLNKILEEGVFL